jgi:hypothetical protein
MQTTRQFLAAVRRVLEDERGEKVSDYRLAKELGVTRSAMSRYLLGKNTFDERVGARVSGVLGLHPGYVAACIQAERATLPESRSMWEGVANLLRGVAALLILGAVFVLYGELAGGELVAFIPAAFAVDNNMHCALILLALAAAVFLILLSIQWFTGRVRRSSWRTPGKSFRRSA